MFVKMTVMPGAKKESVVESSPGVLRVSVREPAERNLANRRVRELVASRFGVPLGKARIVAGHRSRSKIVSVDVSA